MPASTCRRCIRPARRRRRTAGPRTPSSRPPKPATRPASRSASASARPPTSVDTAGAFFHVVRRRAGRRQGQHHGQVRRGAPGARILRQGSRSSFRRMRRPGTTPRTTSGWSRAGRADHEPAERLGGRQARRAAGRRAVLDARHAVGPEGPLRAVPAVLLGHLELRARTSRRRRACWCICRSRRRSRSWWRRAAATTCRPSPS